MRSSGAKSQNQFKDVRLLETGMALALSRRRLQIQAFLLPAVLLASISEQLHSLSPFVYLSLAPLLSGIKAWLYT